MRTAADVIKRVRWDPVLEPHRSHVVIGFVDRFKGVLEAKFPDFNFADIPEHRIAHFKFRGITVWEKETRRDDVFGSTGSGVTLADVVHEWEESNPGAVEEEAAEAIRRAEPGKANFFVAFRVTDPGILAQAGAVQRHITAQDPRLEVACTPLQSLHVTLCMLELRNAAQIRTACDVMRDLRTFLQESLGGCEVAFEGLGVFRERVLFAQPQDTSNLSKFAARVREAMSAAGLRVADGRKEFRPHCTLVKLDRGLCRTVPEIDRAHYTSYINTRFGTQPIHAMYLCSSVSPKRGDGFYTTAAVVLAYRSEEVQAAEEQACAGDAALLLGQAGDPRADAYAEGDGEEEGADAHCLEEYHAEEEAAPAAAAAAIRDSSQAKSDNALREAGLVPLQLAREVSDAARDAVLSPNGRREWKAAIADVVTGGTPSDFSDHANRLSLIRTASSLASAFATAAVPTLCQAPHASNALPSDGVGAGYPASEADAFCALVRVLTWIRCATEATPCADHERQIKGVLAVLRGVRGCGKTRLAHAIFRAGRTVDNVFTTAPEDVRTRACAASRGAVHSALANSDQGTGGVRLASLVMAAPCGAEATPIEELLDTGIAWKHAAHCTPPDGVFAPLSPSERAACGQGPARDLATHGASPTCVIARPSSLITDDPDGGRRVPAKRRQQAASRVKEVVANGFAANIPLVVIDDTHASPADYAWPWRLAEVTGRGRTVLNIACVTRALAVVMGRRARPPLSEDAAISGWATWIPHKDCETLLSPALSHGEILSVARLERETLRAVRQLRRRATHVVGDSNGPAPSFGLTALGGDVSTLEAEGGAAKPASGAAHASAADAARSVALATELDNVRHPAVVYTGLFLTPESRRALLEAVGVAFEEVHADHLTVSFTPSVACVRCHPVGARASLRVTAMATCADDVQVQCVSAELDIPPHAPPGVQLMPFLISSRQPHITISVPAGQPASASIRALRTGAATPLPHDPPLRLEAVAGIVIKDTAVPGGPRRTFLDLDSFQAWATAQAPNLPLTQAPDAITVTAALRACGTDPEEAGVIDVIEAIRSPTPVVSPALRDASPAVRALGPAAIRCIHVFDWDGTLCRSVDPEIGVQRWEVAHGTPWPFEDFLGQPESLTGPLAPEAGPALHAFREAVARTDALTIVITGRPARAAAGLHSAARRMGIYPHGWFFKPVGTHPTAPFKQRTLQRVLQAVPGAQRVEVWEDEEQAIQAYHAVGRADKRLSVIAHRVRATDPCPAAQGAVHEALLTAAPAVSQLAPFLARSGAIRLRTADEAACEALAWVVSNLASLVAQLCPSLADAGLLQCPNSIVVPHGSWPLGRTFHDVDAILIAPDMISATDLVSTAAQALRNAGLRFVHEAAPARCPSVRCRIPTASGRVTDVDVAFARAPARSVAAWIAAGTREGDSGARSQLLTELRATANASQDAATRAALQGPEFLQRIRHVLNDTGVDAACFCVAADAVLAALEPLGWLNTALHAPRPFQWVQWMAEECPGVVGEDSHAASAPDALAAGLLRAMAAANARAIAVRFTPAVPRAYAVQLRIALGQLAATSDETAPFLPAPALASLCSRRARQLGETHRPVAITITGSKAEAQWRAQLLVSAKIGTAVRSMVREGLDVVPLPRIHHASRACVRHLGFAANLPDPLGILSEWTRESPATDDAPTGDRALAASMQSPPVDVVPFAIPQGPRAKAAAKRCLAPAWAELRLALGKSTGCRVDVHFPSAALLPELLE